MELAKIIMHDGFSVSFLELWCKTCGWSSFRHNKAPVCWMDIISYYPVGEVQFAFIIHSIGKSTHNLILLSWQTLRTPGKRATTPLAVTNWDRLQNFLFPKTRKSIAKTARRACPGSSRFMILCPPRRITPPALPPARLRRQKGHPGPKPPAGSFGR